MTSTPEQDHTCERSEHDLAALEVMGEEIIEMTDSRVNLKVQLKLTQKRLAETVNTCNELAVQNENLDSKNRELARQHSNDQESIRHGGEQNRRLMADNDALRHRISELTKPAYETEIADEGFVEFKDPQDGPVIDTV